MPGFTAYILISLHNALFCKLYHIITEYTITSSNKNYMQEKSLIINFRKMYKLGDRSIRRQK